MKKSMGELTMVIIVFIVIALLVVISNSFVNKGIDDIKQDASNLYSNLVE